MAEESSSRSARTAKVAGGTALLGTINRSRRRRRGRCRRSRCRGDGSGPRLTPQLVRELFLPAFDNPALRTLDGQAVLNVVPGRIAMTTDSYVVTPLFFPGGDIGRLAVNGTVNDLAWQGRGARPLYLTAAFIIEEGLPLEDMERVVHSMARGPPRTLVSRS